jgi:CheY-like chemotaxis protein
MGATLDIDSTAGEGTVATLWLPVADPATGSDAPRPSPLPPDRDAAPAPPPPGGRARRVLYVEDNPVNALLMQEMLAALGGVETRVAEDADAALALLSHWTPDLLVLDAHLPGLDGYGLLALLRRRPGFEAIPAVMCSADAMPEDRERALAAGFLTCWTKPLDLQRIAADLAALGPVT